MFAARNDLRCLHFGRLFGPLAAFADGPFPEHYEPIESPVANPLHPGQSTNPVVKKFTTPLDKYSTTGDGYDIVCTNLPVSERGQVVTPDSDHDLVWARIAPQKVD